MSPAALLKRPKLVPHDYRYLDAFNVLSKARQRGMDGPQPIQVAEIVAFFNLAGVESQRDKARYTRVIQQLDGVYLDHMTKKLEAARSAKA